MDEVSTGPRRCVLHQSLIRPILVGGGERNLVHLNGVISAALIFGIGSIYAVILGLIFAVIAQYGLVALAKKDAQFFDVYRRHILYQDYYPPRALESAPIALVKYWEP